MFQQPFVDEDPDKEKKIKELELLLMSAENEVRRKRIPTVRNKLMCLVFIVRIFYMYDCIVFINLKQIGGIFQIFIRYNQCFQTF